MKQGRRKQASVHCSGVFPEGYLPYVPEPHLRQPTATLPAQLNRADRCSGGNVLAEWRLSRIKLSALLFAVHFRVDGFGLSLSAL